MKVVAIAHPHRRALFVLLGLLLALGVHAVFDMSRGIYPQVAFPRIAVIAEVGEMPVRQVMVAVTRPIEQAVSAVPDLVRVHSKTVRGASELSLDFSAGADMREALALVRARLGAAGLPADTALTVERQTPAIFPVISFNVIPGERQAGDPVARARLAEWAELELRPRLARLPDAFFVTTQSGDRREYVFEVDPAAMAAAGVTVERIKDCLEANNAVAAVGRSMREGLQFQLVVDGRAATTDDLLEFGVRCDHGEAVPLARLGHLKETIAERTMVVTGGGRDGVVVSVFLRDGGKVTDLAEGVRSIIDDTRPTIEGGATIAMVYDQSRLVQESIGGVRDAILLGALLSIVVMALFLGSWRATLVAGLAIPASVLLTLAALPHFGESLNLMSLGGLAVAIGLVIDDAIVVVENVARRCEGLPRDGGFPAVFGAVCRGTDQVVGAIVGSSLTTVVVFLPLVLLEGVVGQFFRSLALSLGLSILSSMLVSLLYSPLMLLLPGLRPGPGRGPGPILSRVQLAYGRTVEILLDHPLAGALLLFALLCGGAAFLRTPETGFLPAMDEGGFVLDYTLPVGSSLDETDAACRRIEGILGEVPEVASFSRRTGAELGFFATEVFTGDFLVGLVEPGERRRSVFEVIADLRDRLAHEVPQAQIEFVQVMQDTMNDLAGNPEPIEVRLLGDDYPRLQKAAHAVAERIDKIHGIVDVAEGVSFGSPDLVWRPDPARLARLGLDTSAIAAEVSAQLLGVVATRIQEGDRFVDVRVRYPESWRRDVAGGGESGEIFVSVPDADERPALEPLSAIAQLSRSFSENELERENQVPVVRVTAAVEGRDLGSASRAVEAAVRALPQTRSPVHVEFGGQAASQKSAFENMLMVFGLGTGLVFLLLVVQFRSLMLPFVIFLALPFGQVGALWALQLTGVPLNVSSGMGMVMLVGLVVKNGIIMIEYAQELAREGHPEREAVLDAARVRLRPILMTTLAAVAGLVPLALGLAPGMELQRPLAIAVIGGLLVSTSFTLLVVPLGCATLGRGRLQPEVRHDH